MALMGPLRRLTLGIGRPASLAPSPTAAAAWPGGGARYGGPRVRASVRLLSSSGLDPMQQIRERARKEKKRVLLPESQDSRVIQAAQVLAKEGLCDPVLLDTGSKAKGELPASVEVINPKTDQRLTAFAEELHGLRKNKGLTLEAAHELAAKPLVFAGLLLRKDGAAACVAGSEAATSDVLRAGLWTVGLQPGLKTLSSCFLMLTPDGQAFTFGDCAVIPDPTAEQLADIAVSSAKSHQKLLGVTPRVALLSFSTKGSAEHSEVDKVKAAGKILQERNGTLLFDDELQLDAAIVPSVGKKKAPGSKVAGTANVLIFPDLNSGNIGYKLTQRLGGAAALGPVVQGFQKPYLDLSRGCSADDIVAMACIASCLAP